MRRLALVIITLIVAGCGDGEPEQSTTIGGVSVPLSSLESLGIPERHGLADLIGFGVAVSRGDLAAFGVPIVNREVLRSRLENLPYQLGADSLGIDESSLRSLYERNPEWELVVRHVIRLADVASSRAARDSARTVAEDVATRARAGDDFAALAAGYSQEPGAAQRGGLLQPGRRGSWVEPFWTAALSLRPGETSGVVQSEFGYHVLRLEDRRAVPFEEADGAALLRRVVPIDPAIRAMEEWTAGAGAITFHDIAIGQARQLLVDGAAVPDTLLLATDRHGGEYDGTGLAVGWAAVPPDERAVLERPDGSAFGTWLTTDAQETLWGRYAESIGVPADPLTASNAERDWNWMTTTWAAALRFQPGMTDQQLLDAAMAAVLSGAQEPRAARLELRSLRPLLRQSYPLADPAHLNWIGESQ
jgi:hypothetical protein